MKAIKHNSLIVTLSDSGISTQWNSSTKSMRVCAVAETTREELLSNMQGWVLSGEVAEIFRLESVDIFERQKRFGPGINSYLFEYMSVCIFKMQSNSRLVLITN